MVLTFKDALLVWHETAQINLYCYPIPSATLSGKSLRVAICIFLAKHDHVFEYHQEDISSPCFLIKSDFSGSAQKVKR